MPVPRITTRRLMIAVAILAIAFGGWRRRQHRLSLAVLCGIADQGNRHTGAVYRLHPEIETLQTVTTDTPARTPAEIEARRRRSVYWVALKRQYERGAAMPWLPVSPDTPPP